MEFINIATLGAGPAGIGIASLFSSTNMNYIVKEHLSRKKYPKYFISIAKLHLNSRLFIGDFGGIFYRSKILLGKTL